eukprot:12087112-Heterocapsa_arctica.AAC.1
MRVPPDGVRCVALVEIGVPWLEVVDSPESVEEVDLASVVVGFPLREGNENPIKFSDLEISPQEERRKSSRREPSPWAANGLVPMGFRPARLVLDIPVF